jgi:hypothetical protein
VQIVTAYVGGCSRSEVAEGIAKFERYLAQEPRGDDLVKPHLLTLLSTRVVAARRAG